MNLTAKQFSTLHNLTLSRVHQLCQQDLIPAARFGKSWAIPEDAVLPPDGRSKEARHAKMMHLVHAEIAKRNGD